MTSIEPQEAPNARRTSPYHRVALKPKWSSIWIGESLVYSKWFPSSSFVLQLFMIVFMYILKPLPVLHSFFNCSWLCSWTFQWLSSKIFSDFNISRPVQNPKLGSTSGEVPTIHELFLKDLNWNVNVSWITFRWGWLITFYYILSCKRNAKVLILEYFRKND